MNIIAKRVLVKSSVKAHHTPRLVVRASVKAGMIVQSQHNAPRLAVRSNVKAGAALIQHNARRLSA